MGHKNIKQLQNQSVSGVTSICLTQCNTSPSHRVDQVVDCGLWNVGPLLFNGCAKLLDIGRNWNTLSYTLIQSIPNMLNGWHFWWVCWLCKKWDVFSFQELCTDPCNMGLCIIMVQHEVIIVDEWHNNGPQDLVMVSRCIQNAINKMHLCSLSITYACLYHNPTVTMGHSIHNVNISKEKRTPLQSARPPSIVSIFPTQVGYDDELQSGRDPDKDDEHADELPWQFVQKFFGYANRCCSSCPGGLSQMILEVKMLDVEVLGWCGYTWSAVVWPVGLYLPKSLKCLWRWLMVEKKLTFNSRATALVDIPAVSMPFARFLKTCNICVIVLCDKTAHFRVAFYCGQPKAHLCNNHAV